MSPISPNRSLLTCHYSPVFGQGYQIFVGEEPTHLWITPMMYYYALDNARRKFYDMDTWLSERQKD